MTEHEVLAISIDENGFEVDDQGFNFHNISPSVLDSTYSFNLNGNYILCIGKSLYQYSEKKKMWSKLPHEMPHNRIGAACLSFGNKVIIFGGCIDGTITSTIDVVHEDFTINRALDILPFPIKYHTVTKISEDEFILCGGQNAIGHHMNDVYYGQVAAGGSFYLTSEQDWNINWAKLKPLNTARSKHVAFYIRNRLVVLGDEN